MIIILYIDQSIRTEEELSHASKYVTVVLLVVYEYVL